MNQPMQPFTMANLLVASRLPSEGNFRRDAIIGAMVGQVNPMAGALVAVRSADALTELIRERDSLKAQQAAPPVGKPLTAGGAKPVPLDEEGRRFVQGWLEQLIADATRLSEMLKADQAGGEEQEAFSDQMKAEVARRITEAATEMAAAATKIASQAEKVVQNQEEAKT